METRPYLEKLPSGQHSKSPAGQGYVVVEDHEFVLSLPLPPELENKPLVLQLAGIRQVIQDRRRYPGDGPQGPAFLHELRVTPTLSIHLDFEGDFADLEAGHAVTDDLMPTRNGGPRSKQCVIGRRTEGFCWLMPNDEGDQADDQNLERARRFDSLAAAVEAASELSLKVFEIGQEKGRDVLHEMTVDLALVESLPYEGCYQISDLLLAGPSPVTTSSVTTLARMTALSEAGITDVISLVSRAELFWMRSRFDLPAFKGRFRQHSFPVRDGEAPSPRRMQTILDVIDEMIDAGQKVFVHCVGGRGRTGTVIGCWLARHGIGTGHAAIDELTRLRYRCGLFTPSPETEAQRRLATS